MSPKIHDHRTVIESGSNFVIARTKLQIALYATGALSDCDVSCSSESLSSESSIPSHKANLPSTELAGSLTESAASLVAESWTSPVQEDDPVSTMVRGHLNELQ